MFDFLFSSDRQVDRALALFTKEATRLEKVVEKNTLQTERKRVEAEQVRAEAERQIAELERKCSSLALCSERAGRIRDKLNEIIEA